MKMMTSTRQVGGVTIVDISGRIELGGESAAMRDMVRDLLSKPRKLMQQQRHAIFKVLAVQQGRASLEHQ